MVGPTNDHSCERREYAFIVLWEYTIISQHTIKDKETNKGVYLIDPTTIYRRDQNLPAKKYHDLKISTFSFFFSFFH